MTELPASLPPLPPAFESRLLVYDDYGLPFELAQELVYYSAVLHREVVVPKGFRTDLASIPQGLWNILPKTGRYDRASVVHDYLYQHNGCTRGEADAVLQEAMRVLEVPGVRLKLIYAGVRVGGWHSWNKYRKADNGSL